MDHDHHHDHDHDHSELSETQLRVRALETILTEKGYVDPAALDVLIETYETKVGPRNGARVVAKAWSDPAYRAWLLEDANAAIASVGYAGRQGEHIVVVENTPKRHNMVVCTLCSCYPVAGARPAAGLVQVGALSFARGRGASRRAARVRRGVAGGHRNSRLGFDLRSALPGAADAARGQRRLERRTSSPNW